MSTLTLSNDSILIDDGIRDEALDLVEASGEDRLAKIVVVIDGTQHEVPAALSRLLTHVVERAARGGVMHIRSMPEELTTTVAAEMLGVSRPTLMKLIHANEIRSRVVGTHHRVRSRDVIELRNGRDLARREALERLQDSLPD
jgi:excisionase family DNA binding protein